MIYIENLVYSIRKHLMEETPTISQEALDKLAMIEVNFNLLLHDYNNATRASRSVVERFYLAKDENTELKEQLKEKDDIIASYQKV